MRPSSLIGHVAELLGVILAHRQPADAISASFFRGRHYLGSRDRRFISEYLFDILRNHRLLRARASAAFASLNAHERASNPPVISLCAAYIVGIAGQSAEEAFPAVDVLWSPSLPDVSCMAFLETCKNTGSVEDVEPDPARRLAIRYSFPDFAVQEWYERWGEASTEGLCQALNSQAPTTIRVNLLKCSVDACRNALRAEGVETTPTPMSPWGLVLGKRVNTQGLRSFRDGWFEMQDEGSQMIGALAAPAPGGFVIDACAGAGGKSLHLAALMQNRGTIIAIDTEEKRLGNMGERLARAGVSIVRTRMAGDAALGKELSWKADVVLVDAPCSGSGTLRRNPGAKLHLEPESVRRLMNTQSQVLRRYAEFVKPGGRLVYVTCSLLRNENERAVDEFLRAHPAFHLEPATPLLAAHGISVHSEALPLLFRPDIEHTDGFFAAVLKRVD